MAQRQPRFKFKRILLNGGPLMPQGYRLATVKEINSYLHMFKKWEMPVKRISPYYVERSGDIRLLDGWVPADFNVVHEEPNYNCIWNALVKKKSWDSSRNKWQNCSEFFSSGGFSLRKHLYDGIILSTQGIDAAWLQAYCYEDVELLYWLWRTFPHTIQPDVFTNSCQRAHIFMGIDHSIPLREMVRMLESHGHGLQLQMTDAKRETQAVLRNAIDRSRDEPGFIYLYGSTWGVTMVELAIEIYGQDFVDRAASIAFEDAGSVPITTKFLSLFPDQLQVQFPNVGHPVAEVLIEAVKRGYSNLVAKIMELGDKIAHFPRYDYLCALREAVSAGHEDLVKLLLKLSDDKLPEEVDEEDKTLFHYVLPHNLVFLLLYQKYGKECKNASSFDGILTRPDKFGRNVLHWAAKKGGYDSRVVDRLLQRFPPSEDLVHSRDQQMRTPWHIAASKGDLVMIKKLLDYLGNAGTTKRINYIQATDSSGRTALQMAASQGHEDLVTILLDKGSCPIKERDGQRKTALHHAAQVKNPNAALATCKALLEHDTLTGSKRSLLLWASATGIGTADEMEDVHDCVKSYLRTLKRQDREPLLRAAAINDNVDLAWEILSRGADIADIRDPDWTNRLQSLEKESVENVLSQMEHIKEHGRDQPSIEDKLGRYVFAQGLAALFLNRFTEPPVTVGISGEWGMGKSSLMFQTEKILLITAAQLTFPNLLPLEQFVGVKTISLSTRGIKKYQQINDGVHTLLGLSKIESKEQNPLVALLKEYQPQYHDVYKALACMDNIQMLQSSSVSRQQEQEHVFRGVPRILTIQYNAWHYRDQHEAWAGLGVTISKEIEKAMTRAQWMSTCWRYTWAKQRVNIWIQIFLPSLLSIFLAGWVAWIVWILLKQAKFHGLKYGSIPLTVIAIVWVVLNLVNSVVKPVSTQMLGYFTVPDHTTHLGYQEDVINDINFLKKELGEQPHWFFTFVLWCWNWFGLYADNVENTSIPKCMPASGHDIRIVTFVDDLDRCEEKVVLKVLSAINLVLTECKINVILGMDKKMIERAIKNFFQDADDDVAEKFISKIIQIPLNLPDPTDQDSNSFLEYHLRHKIPLECIERKSVSQSQCGLVLAIETPERINGPAREAENDHTVLDIPSDERNRLLQYTETNDANEWWCRGIMRRAGDWLKKLANERSQPYDENLNSLRSAEGVRLIREILLPNYTREEAVVFYKLRSLTTGNQKLPREWKCLLNYHKFAWYVLSLIGNVYSLPMWKEELVGWVFVCWQWKREMNHLIKVWNKIACEQNSSRNIRHSHGPFLSELVTRYISRMQKADPGEVNGQNISLDNLSKLHEALKKQDVSMEGIQLFQQFRFHCEIEYLPSPYG